MKSILDFVRWLRAGSPYVHNRDLELDGGTLTRGWRPMVRMHGAVRYPGTVSICEPAEFNATLSRIDIGEHCDIASYTVFNCADSLKMPGRVLRAPIVLEERVRVGSFAFVGGGIRVGRRSVIAAGTILTGSACARAELKTDEEGLWVIPPLSLVIGNPAEVRPGFYRLNA